VVELELVFLIIVDRVNTGVLVGVWLAIALALLDEADADAEVVEADEELAIGVALVDGGSDETGSGGYCNTELDVGSAGSADDVAKAVDDAARIAMLEDIGAGGVEFADDANQELYLSTTN